MCLIFLINRNRFKKLVINKYLILGNNGFNTIIIIIIFGKIWSNPVLNKRHCTRIEDQIRSNSSIPNMTNELITCKYSRSRL